MRSLIGLAVVAVVTFFAGIYLAYGHVDPCRALAVERARQSAVPTAIAEPWTRMGTNDMSTAACSKEILGSWIERLKRKMS